MIQSSFFPVRRGTFQFYPVAQAISDVSSSYKVFFHGNLSLRSVTRLVHRDRSLTLGIHDQHGHHLHHLHYYRKYKDNHSDVVVVVIAAAAAAVAV